MKKHKLTVIERDSLEKELAYLETEKSKSLLEEIKNYKETGVHTDSSDDEYIRAQSVSLKQRIDVIKDILTNCEIVDNSNKNYIDVGAVVVCKDLDLDDCFEVMVANQLAKKEGFIASPESPIGKSLLNKKIGDIVNAITPSGLVNLEVLGISY